MQVPYCFFALYSFILFLTNVSEQSLVHVLYLHNDCLFNFSYGDKTPKGPIARVFAVFWMLVGITLCSMYTATLTGAITSAVYSENDFSFVQKKVVDT